MRAIEETERRILRLLSSRGNLEFWEIAKLTGESLPSIVRSLENLDRAGYIKRIGSSFEITDLGRKLAGDLGLSYRSLRCEYCSGRGVLLDGLGEDIIETFREICARRPSMLMDYDQAPVTPESTLSRVAFILDRGDLDGKDIIFLGDDDLTSVASALTGKPSRVFVLDIDERLIKTIEKISEEYSLRIETLVHDLRDPLPEEIREKFEVFVTDPPDTIRALRLFISRGVESLRRRRRMSGYFGVSKQDFEVEQLRQIQEIIVSELGLTITDIVSQFNLYEIWGYEKEQLAHVLPDYTENPRIRWFYSDLYRVETTDRSKPCVIGRYTGELGELYEYMKGV